MNDGRLSSGGSCTTSRGPSWSFDDGVYGSYNTKVKNPYLQNGGDVSPVAIDTMGFNATKLDERERVDHVTTSLLYMIISRGLKKHGDERLYAAPYD